MTLKDGSGAAPPYLTSEQLQEFSTRTQEVLNSDSVKKEKESVAGELLDVAGDVVTDSPDLLSMAADGLGAVATGVADLAAGAAHLAGDVVVGAIEVAGAVLGSLLD